MKKFITAAARDDILRQYRYLLIEQERPLIAERFRRAVEAEVKQLCKRPAAGSPVNVENPQLAGLRSWRIDEFPAIRIYYLSSKNLVRIIRVLHGKRDVSAILEDESFE